MDHETCHPQLVIREVRHGDEVRFGLARRDSDAPPVEHPTFSTTLADARWWAQRLVTYLADRSVLN